MLKIYLQIFGTIALCFILFLNYQVFGQKPMKAEIIKTKAEVQALQKKKEVLESILEYKTYFKQIEECQFDDYKDVNIFFASTFSEPLFMNRIQKMVELSGCTNTGILVSKTTAAKNKIAFEKFKTSAKEKDKEKLNASIKAFVDTMKAQRKDSKKWEEIVAPTSDYGKRLTFYKSLGEGKKYPKSMGAGFELHRFSLTLKGPYNSCKKFLWLVSQNRPFTQATVQSFSPVMKRGQGGKAAEAGIASFSCRIIVLTIVDKNARMQATLLKGMESMILGTGATTTPVEPPKEVSKEGTLEQPKEGEVKPVVEGKETKPLTTPSEPAKASDKGSKAGLKTK